MDETREFNRRMEYETREVRVRGISQKTIQELNNIADHSGVTLSNLLRPKLVEIAHSFPEAMRQPKAE